MNEWPRSWHPRHFTQVVRFLRQCTRWQQAHHFIDTLQHCPRDLWQYHASEAEQTELAKWTELLFRSPPFYLQACLAYFHLPDHLLLYYFRESHLACFHHHWRRIPRRYLFRWMHQTNQHWHVLVICCNVWRADRAWARALVKQWLEQTDISRGYSGAVFFQPLRTELQQQLAWHPHVWSIIEQYFTCQDYARIMLGIMK